MKKAVLNAMRPFLFLLLFAPLASLQAADLPQHSMNQEEDVRRELWSEFHKLRFERFGKFVEVRLYAENDALNRICFISEGGLFMFFLKDPSDNNLSRIETLQPAKALNYDKINRITYNKDGFQLWYYEELALSIGSY